MPVSEPPLPVVEHLEPREVREELVLVGEPALRRLFVALQVAHRRQLDEDEAAVGERLLDRWEERTLAVVEARDEIEATVGEPVALEVDDLRLDAHPFVGRRLPGEGQPDRADVGRDHLETAAREPDGDPPRARGDVDGQALHRDLRVELAEPTRGLPTHVLALRIALVPLLLRVVAHLVDAHCPMP